jgi:hypothetical protein
MAFGLEPLAVGFDPVMIRWWLLNDLHLNASQKYLSIKIFLVLISLIIGSTRGIDTDIRYAIDWF